MELRWLVVDGQGRWVPINPGRGWGPLNRLLPDMPQDPTAAARHTSGDPLRPGDHPPRLPRAVYDLAAGIRSGIDYLRRGPLTDWIRYQLQISGWTRTPDGAIPEWKEPHPDGGTIAYDGRTTRNDTIVYLEAKHGYELLARNPRTLDTTEYQRLQDITTRIEDQVKRQIAALPRAPSSNGTAPTPGQPPHSSRCLKH